MKCGLSSGGNSTLNASTHRSAGTVTGADFSHTLRDSKSYTAADTSTLRASVRSFTRHTMSSK